MEYSGPTSENLYVWVRFPGQLVIKQLHAPAFSPWMDNSKKKLVTLKMLACIIPLVQTETLTSSILTYTNVIRCSDNENKGTCKVTITA